MMRKLMMGLVLLAICMFPCNNTFAKVKIDKILKDIFTKQDISVLTNHVAPIKTISTDGTYYEGYVSYIGGKERNNQPTPYQYFKFVLTEPVTLKLHFISHIEKYVGIELRDSDENVIRPFSKRIYVQQSPFTETVTLNKGRYTFTIFKFKSSSTTSNTGDYKFKFESVEIE